MRRQCYAAIVRVIAHDVADDQIVMRQAGIIAEQEPPELFCEKLFVTVE